METNQFSFKDFENVVLKATQNMEIGDRKLVPGEPIAIFDKIQISGFNEVISRVSANGGFDNRAHVWWETTKEIRLTFQQGVFSSEQFALSINSKLIVPAQNEKVQLVEVETLESSEMKILQLSHVPVGDVFIYAVPSGAPVQWTYLGDNRIEVTESYTCYMVHYIWEYENHFEIYHFGDRLSNGTYYLEGRTSVKDDITGQVTTAVLRVPKLKLMSDLSMRLGKQAKPVVANFQATGIPVGVRGKTYVTEFILLSNDLGADF